VNIYKIQINFVAGCRGVQMKQN